MDVNKYTSCHHGKKIDSTEFVGDYPRKRVNRILPKSYKYFYDEEIKKINS